MVSPHGYPDWNRQASVSDVHIDQGIGNVIVDGATVYSGYVGNFRSIGMRLDSATTGMRFTFRFSHTAGAVVRNAVHAIDVRSATPYQGSIPVMAPYLDVVVNAAAAGQTIDWILWGNYTTGRPNAGDPLGSILIADNNTTVNAGVTKVVNAGLVHPGDAYWTCRQSSGSWSALLEALDYQGNVTAFDVMSSAGGQEGHHNVVLPAMPVRISFTNSDAANHTHHVFLAAHTIGQDG